MDTVTCSFTPENLPEIRENFKISPSLNLVVPTPSQTIKTPPEGFVGIYHQFLKAGLRFPVFDFLKTVLGHYNLHIAQLAPNSFRKIICFVMLSRALGVSPSLTIFRHFYVTLVTGDWVTFTRRHSVDDMCDGLPSSIKKWKPEFMFVDAKEFGAGMTFGEHKNRAVDHPPELSVEQKLLADQMVANSVKWSDPDEVMLGMAGLSTYWAGLGKQPIFVVGGKTVTLLDRLQRKKFKGATEVIEGPIVGFFGPSVLDTALEDELSMDSASMPESVGDGVSASMKSGRRSQKSERIAGRPPSHPTRVAKEVFVVKKRGVPAGGPPSPDSGKSLSSSEENKESSNLKQCELVRGGNHPNAMNSVLFECLVSADSSLADAVIASDASPAEVIVFPASQLPSTASLGKILIPLYLTLADAGLGFGKFASAVLTVPEPLVSSVKAVGTDAGSIEAITGISDSMSGILTVPSVRTSPDAPGKSSGLAEPVSLEGLTAVGKAPHPTLVSLAAALPGFVHPYAVSGVGRTPGLGGMSEEEGLDRARSLFMEGMHWVTKVEFDSLNEEMGEERSKHMALMDEKTKLAREVQQMELRNQELMMEVDAMKEKQQELVNTCQSTEKQLVSIQQYREADLKRLEEAGQEFESLKTLFGESFWQEVELQDQKIQLLGLEEQVQKLTKECSVAKQDSLIHQQMSEQHAGDLSWLLKQGVAASVHFILNSKEFGNLNDACQTAAIQVGLTQACLEMKDKYSSMVQEPLLHSYPHSQEELMDRFVEMTSYEYQLLKMLKAGSVDVGSLKKYLDEREVNEAVVASEGVGNDEDKKVKGGDLGADEPVIDKSEGVGDSNSAVGDQDAKDSVAGGSEGQGAAVVDPPVVVGNVVGE
ncbi:hypothetical protein LXL04_039821 [Taraxacum kok-saghyz]